MRTYNLCIWDVVIKYDYNETNMVGNYRSAPYISKIWNARSFDSTSTYAFKVFCLDTRVIDLLRLPDSQAEWSFLHIQAERCDFSRQRTFRYKLYKWENVFGWLVNFRLVATSLCWTLLHCPNSYIRYKRRFGNWLYSEIWTSYLPNKTLNFSLYTIQ
jgi:hypothetical protein